MEYTSLEIRKIGSKSWAVIPNGIDADLRWQSDYTGGGFGNFITIKSINGAQEWKNIPYTVISYTDVVTPANNRPSFSSPQEFQIYAKQTGFFVDGDSGTGTATSFNELTDTPDTKTGSAGKAVVVSYDETQLEYELIPIINDSTDIPDFPQELIEGKYLKVVGGVYTLVDAIEGTQNNIGKKVILGYTDATPTINLAVTRANQIGFVVSEQETPVLLYFRSITGTFPIKQYNYIFLAGKGTYGTGNTTVTSGMLYALPTTFVTPEEIEDDPNSVTFNLDPVVDGDFVTKANTTFWDFSDSTYPDDGMNFYFSYTDDGVLYYALFVGDPNSVDPVGIYGTGGTPFTEDDFVTTTNDTVQPIPDPKDTLWIKSNGDLTKAQRVGDILYGILDQYTGEEMTLEKTDPAEVNGITVFLVGEEYFKRVNPRGVYNIRWFGAKADGSDCSEAILLCMNSIPTTSSLYPLWGRSTIFFPKGDWIVNQTISPDYPIGLVLRGVGQFSTSITTTNDSGDIFDYTAYVNVTTEDIVFIHKTESDRSTWTNTLFNMNGTGGGRNFVVNRCYFFGFNKIQKFNTTQNEDTNYWSNCTVADCNTFIDSENPQGVCNHFDNITWGGGIKNIFDVAGFQSTLITNANIVIDGCVLKFKDIASKYNDQGFTFINCRSEWTNAHAVANTQPKWIDAAGSNIGCVVRMIDCHNIQGVAPHSGALLFNLGAGGLQLNIHGGELEGGWIVSESVVSTDRLNYINVQNAFIKDRSLWSFPTSTGFYPSITIYENEQDKTKTYSSVPMHYYGANMFLNDGLMVSQRDDVNKAMTWGVRSDGIAYVQTQLKSGGAASFLINPYLGSKTGIGLGVEPAEILEVGGQVRLEAANKDANAPTLGQVKTLVNTKLTTPTGSTSQYVNGTGGLSDYAPYTGLVSTTGTGTSLVTESTTIGTALVLLQNQITASAIENTTMTATPTPTTLNSAYPSVPNFCRVYTTGTTDNPYTCVKMPSGTWVITPGLS